MCMKSIRWVDLRKLSVKNVLEMMPVEVTADGVVVFVVSNAIRVDSVHTSSEPDVHTPSMDNIRGKPVEPLHIDSVQTRREFDVHTKGNTISGLRRMIQEKEGKVEEEEEVEEEIPVYRRGVRYEPGSKVRYQGRVIVVPEIDGAGNPVW